MRVTLAATLLLGCAPAPPATATDTPSSAPVSEPVDASAETVFTGPDDELFVLRGGRAWTGRTGQPLARAPWPRPPDGPLRGKLFEGPRGWTIHLVGLDATLSHPTEAAGLIEAADVVQNLRVELAYIRPGPLIPEAVYPQHASCLLTRPTAEALRAAQTALGAHGLQLLVWDCYRPLPVQERIWAVLPDPRYVAPPTGRGSSHNRGAAVDVGVIGHDGSARPLPTAHDAFGPRAARDAGVDEGLDDVQIANRDTLAAAMKDAGFAGLTTEWWHYSGPDAAERTALSVPFPGARPGDGEGAVDR